MSPIIIYLLGFLTPFIIGLILNILCCISDWKYQRRYRRAWDKFSSEYDGLSSEDKLRFLATKIPNSTVYGSERERYFASKWQYGMTKEV